MLLVIRVTSIRISDDMVVGQAFEWKIILTLVHFSAAADDGVVQPPSSICAVGSLATPARISRSMWLPAR